MRRMPGTSSHRAILRRCSHSATVRPDSGMTPTNWATQISRKAQERLLMNQVVSEMRANLRTIEQVLDAFFRDQSKRDELASLDKPVHQLLGALEMLGEQRARESLAAVADEIRRFSGAA